MPGPMPLKSGGIKRSTSQEFEEPPNKRAYIPGDLTPDRGYDADSSILERKLVPMISRSETSQLEGYIPDASYAEETGKDDDDDSGDEFVDAQEAVVQAGWGSPTMSFGEFSAEQNRSGNAAVKIEAGTFPPGQQKEGEGTGEIDMLREGEVIGQHGNTKQDGSEDSIHHETPPKSEEKNTSAWKIKPEAISIESDTDEEEQGGESKHTRKTHSAETKDDIVSSTGVDENQNKQITISVEDDDEDDEDAEKAELVPFEDIWDSTFGKSKAKVEKSVDKDSNSSFSSRRGKDFVSGAHATTVRNGSHHRQISTPPTTPPPTTVSTRPAPTVRRYPDIRRDLSNDLVRHEKFHTRAQLLIPRLPNHENFDWTRRYWIAVLIEGKRPTKTNISEKDFVWMKGNRFSTVATVFHSYALAVMADTDDLALILGYEGVEMTDQMQELDYFNDRLVVFRAVKVQGNETEAEGRSLVPGMIPESAVISLDLD